MLQPNSNYQNSFWNKNRLKYLQTAVFRKFFKIPGHAQEKKTAFTVITIKLFLVYPNLEGAEVKSAAVT